MLIAEHIIRQIRDLGYAVSGFEMKVGIGLSGNELPVPAKYVEMHAVKMTKPIEAHIARVDGHGEDAEYRCACELARMAGIDLRA